MNDNINIVGMSVSVINHINDRDWETTDELVITLYSNNANYIEEFIGYAKSTPGNFRYFLIKSELDKLEFIDGCIGNTFDTRVINSLCDIPHSIDTIYQLFFTEYHDGQIEEN